MRVPRALLLTALFVVICCACAKSAHAQYLVLSSSIVHNPSTGNVEGFSRTEMDYWAAGYYGVYAGGYLYRGSETSYLTMDDDFGYYPDFDAVAATSYAAAPNTSYQLYTHHYIDPVYAGGCGFNGQWDYYNFYISTYPQGYLGESRTVYPSWNSGACYLGTIYLGYTVKGVTTPQPTISLTNPHVTGNLNGLTQKAMIGAEVKLKAEASYSGGTYDWNVAGGQLRQIVSLSADKKNIEIRWTETGTYRATVTYTLNGNSTSSYIDVNVIIPKLTKFSGTQDADVLTRDAGCSDLPPGATHTVGCSTNTEAGTKWNTTAVAPAGTYLTDLGRSGIKFVQAVNKYRKWLSKGNVWCLTHRANDREEAFDSGWQLDLKDPFNTIGHPPRFFSLGLTLNMSDSDSPGHQLDGLTTDGKPFSLDAYYANNTYITYVFYFVGNAKTPVFQRVMAFDDSALPPGIANQQYAHLAWTFKAQASFNWGVNFVKYKQDFSNSSTGPLQGVPVNVVMNMSSIADDNELENICPDTTPTTNPIDHSEFFVKQHYYDFLLRNNPAQDQGGYDYWRTQITQCGFSFGCIDAYRVAVSRAFWDSADFQNRPDIQASGLVNPPGSARPYNNTQFVRWCYKIYLGKEPDQDGWTFWLDGLTRHGDYNEVIRAFLLSGDYRARFQP